MVSGMIWFMLDLPFTVQPNWALLCRKVPDPTISSGESLLTGGSLCSTSGPGKYLEAGTYGLAAEMFPDGISGLTDRYSDLGFDVQYEQTFANMDLIVHSTYIHEHRVMDASLKRGTIDNSTLNLNTFKVDGTVMVKRATDLPWLISQREVIFPPDFMVARAYMAVVTVIPQAVALEVRSAISPGIM